MRQTRLLGGGLLCVALSGCFSVGGWRPSLHDPADGVIPTGPDIEYLKVHMSSGELYVLSSWSRLHDDGTFAGAGRRYAADRAPMEWRDAWSFHPDSIALLESNDKEAVSRFALSGLVTYSTFMGLFTAVCLADPKGCFGSCPTFYGEDPDRPLAEGFSRSFARALEERDHDDLGLTAGPGAFSLLMRNEALETHAVRHARIAAVPIGPGEDIVIDRAGRYWIASAPVEPIGCRSLEGDCLSAVRAVDDREYAPLTDAGDLGAREEVVLDFPEQAGRIGIVLAARQSLVSTFVFYQALAYAGAETGELLAALERGEPWARRGALAVPDALGDIEVFAREGGGPWELVGVFDEAGPIATDTHVLPLEASAGGRLQVRLRMARGSWRVDRVAVATLAPASEPLLLEPDSVTGREGRGDALEQLTDPDRYLVTIPGSALRLWFTVPEGHERYALFLDTQGYYYEWMRAAWMAEEDGAAVGMMMLSPDEALRALAPAFKRIEPTMERLFWSSRFRR